MVERWIGVEDGQEAWGDDGGCGVQERLLTRKEENESCYELAVASLIAEYAQGGGYLRLSEMQLRHYQMQ